MKIVIMPENLCLDIDPQLSLADALAQAGLPLEAVCGGRGTCGKCRVRLLDVPPPLAQEQAKLSQAELAAGWRLACLQQPREGLHLELPQTVLITDKGALAGLPSDFIPQPRPGLGLAVDIGTTTVAALLWDLQETKLLASAALPNPQGAYGADVISRITFALEQEGNTALLQQVMLSCLDSLTATLLQTAGRAREELVRLVCVANTTMSHLLLGHSPKGLARLPFVPAFAGAPRLSAGELGLTLPPPQAEVIVLPNIASHIGSDITAGLVATRLHKRPGKQILLDIGTNGEIVLVAEGRLLGCSTAAGPVFEGAGIRQGMRASAGAINSASLLNGALQLTTLEDQPAHGICGAGLLDIIAALLDAGVILPSGRLLPPTETAKLGLPPAFQTEQRQDGLCFPLTKQVALYQQDIRLTQTGKGAIRAGIELLLHNAGIGYDELDKVLIAGAFGNHIRVASALRLGLLPPLPPERIEQVGHTAGLGASLALLSDAEYELACALPQQVQHVELAAEPTFQDTFISNMAFPKQAG